MEPFDFVYEAQDRKIYCSLGDKGLRRLFLAPWKQDEVAEISTEMPETRRAKQLRAALECYFAGETVGFSEIPLDLSQGTTFQQAVWRTAAKIPWGSTGSYGAIAKALGKTGHAARAVGQALGRNPIPIIIPCHRVLSSSGALGGFSAGLDWKKILLRLEGHELP